ncbi:hypothetical protein JQ629_22520 [Bradyrhizobium sp. AUGA SZCCT0222]|uniref:hypothetical protein n=1 Tax=Bradyrhizobium sp. AUGA SZCCT0222 TaxID=2807668 RepID=UPI001BA59116|nr:hypothetical protein [Bradyrhizobium sp. AUGA SZCCT0222]MBR1270254.1 hypothetical protein [Bradyrhizobium sp. AUGA SZCCT0222]
MATRLQGVEVVGVMMFRTDQDTPASVLSRSAAHDAKLDTASQIAGLEIDARIALAGPVGDALYRKSRLQSRRMRDGASHDIAVSESCAIRVALLMAGEPIPELQPGDRGQIEVDVAIVENADVILRRLRQDTAALLNQHWTAVERVPEALFNCDLLDQTELDRLIVAPP